MSHVITTVYAPNPAAAEIAVRCARATAREFGDVPRIAAVDAVIPGLISQLYHLGFEILALPDGHPPRHGRLLSAALARMTGPLVWTIEMDCEIHPGGRAAGEALLAEFPQAVAIELASRGAPEFNRGRPCEPSREREVPANAIPGRDDLWAVDSLSPGCTCWRGDVLRGLPWSEAPDLYLEHFLACHLRPQGRLLLTRAGTYTHWRHVSTRARRTAEILDAP